MNRSRATEKRRSWGNCSRQPHTQSSVKLRWRLRRAARCAGTRSSRRSQRDEWESAVGPYSDKTTVTELVKCSNYPEVVQYALGRAEAFDRVLATLGKETSDAAAVARIARFASKKGDLLALAVVSENTRVNPDGANERLSKVTVAGLEKAQSTLKSGEFVRVLKAVLKATDLRERTAEHAIEAVLAHPEEVAEVIVQARDPHVSRTLANKAVERRQHGVLFHVANTQAGGFACAKKDLEIAREIQRLAAEGLRNVTLLVSMDALRNLPVGDENANAFPAKNARNAIQGLLRYGSDEVAAYLIQEMTRKDAPAEYPMQVNSVWKAGEDERDVPKIQLGRVEKARKQVILCNAHWSALLWHEGTLVDRQQHQGKQRCKC